MSYVGIATRVKPELASSRFRLIIPSQHVKRYQYRLGSGDITIFPKDAVPLDEVKTFSGVKLWDVCDDHFDNPAKSRYYRSMLDLADVVTCTTPYLKERIWQLGRDSTVISDPLEFPQRAPKIGFQKLLWYGHSSNLDPLFELDLSGYDLAIVTNKNEDWCLPWSHENMRKGLEWCDVVIIPVKQETQKASYLAKSPNRMTEAINAGRFVVANDMPAYRDYGMYLGDIKEGLEWIRGNINNSEQKLIKAQSLVLERHSPRVIAAQWESLFDSILGVETKSGKDSSTATSLETGQEKSPT
jgi:hypothetical protein